MKIQVLVENTTKREDLQAEHGLSIYVEAGKHKILFDMGQTEVFAENAKRLGIDLSEVDIAILSHGHYDHGGGLTRFLEINSKAPVYISRYAFMPHYNGSEKYIGLAEELKKSKRLVFTEDVLEINSEMRLYSCNDKKRLYAFDSFGLNMLEKGILFPDDFRHEQYLMICEDDKKVLLSGCSHKGILNIVSWFEPDVLVGGFHFMKLDPAGDGAERLKLAARQLMKYDTRYYTGHCTGVEQYEFLKGIMGEQLEYFSTGETVTI